MVVPSCNADCRKEGKKDSNMASNMIQGATPEANVHNL